MNRRGFFATLAALCAAPLALFRAPKADGRLVHWDTQIFEEPMITTGGIQDEFAARKRFAHECHWKPRLDCSVEVCTVCGDSRSRMTRLADDDHERHLQAHLDAMWANGKPSHEVWGPALKRISPRTRAP